MGSSWQWSSAKEGSTHIGLVALQLGRQLVLHGGGRPVACMVFGKSSTTSDFREARCQMNATRASTVSCSPCVLGQSWPCDSGKDSEERGGRC